MKKASPRVEREKEGRGIRIFFAPPLSLFYLCATSSGHGKSPMLS
jgi:hypothetical protein